MTLLWNLEFFQLDISLTISERKKLLTYKKQILNKKKLFCREDFFQINKIMHSTLGEIKLIDTSGPIYKVILADEQELHVDSEESAGTIIWPYYKKIETWVFEIQVEKLKV